MSTQARIEDYPPGKYGLPHMGAVIVDHRIKAGWTTQEEFAIVCGVDKKTVVYWESSGYLADMNRRIFLCKLLKIPPGLLGLTVASLIDTDKAFTATQELSELLQENAYALYEDILIFAHTSTDKYSPSGAYRFYKHQQELEQIVRRAPELEKDAWTDLLSRFYQHSTFIAQHHKRDEEALSLANKAITLAESLQDDQLLGTALYRRSRVHLIQNRPDLARDDIQIALDKAKKARPFFKGSSYLLSAEVNALYAQGDETLKKQCRTWQENAGKLLYGQIEDDGTFLTFNLYAVHHERAKVLLRFALFHTNNNELLEQLKNQRRANREIMKEAKSALNLARKHLEAQGNRSSMYLSITEAKAYIIDREIEESAKIAKIALQLAQKVHSYQGIEEIKQLYIILNQLTPKNPYVANLGVTLGVFPTRIV